MQHEERTALLPDPDPPTQRAAGALWTVERAFLEEVLRQMHKGVVVAAPSGRLILENAQVRQIWGQQLAPATTHDLYAAYQGFHPEERPYTPEEWPLERSLRTGEVVSDEEIAFTHG